MLYVYLAPAYVLKSIYPYWQYPNPPDNPRTHQTRLWGFYDLLLCILPLSRPPDLHAWMSVRVGPFKIYNSTQDLNLHSQTHTHTHTHIKTYTHTFGVCVYVSVCVNAMFHLILLIHPNLTPSLFLVLTFFVLWLKTRNLPIPQKCHYLTVEKMFTFSGGVVWCGLKIWHCNGEGEKVERKDFF